MTLAGDDPLPPQLAGKLQRLLLTPVVVNSTAATRPSASGPDAVLHVAEWNIRHGDNQRDIALALSDPAAFSNVSRTNPAQPSAPPRQLAGELSELQAADIIVLDEVDDGVKRTGYRNVAKELAESLQMNYVFGVEFIELDRIYLGIHKLDLVDEPRARAAKETFGVDPARYKGLEGSAILSRYPIRNAAIIRLPDCYDWFHGEIKAISDLERLRRWSAQQLFEEDITRQVRRGSRMALIVQLEVPGSPTGTVTVVSPHLEDYTGPRGRRDQMNFLLQRIQTTADPLVLAGDLNTMGHNSRPKTIKGEILRYLASYRFWIRQAFFFVTPVPGLGYMVRAANYFKNFHDPTAFSVPILLPNPSKRLFNDLERFRFSDGTGFDFSGERRRSFRHRGRPLADSNQRAWKGFSPTFSFKRTFHGLIGEYKLDWILAKPSRATGSPANPFVCLPSFGRTLKYVNAAPDHRISDHDPITAEISLQPETSP